jgi:hypothetical protein
MRRVCGGKRQRGEILPAVKRKLQYGGAEALADREICNPAGQAEHYAGSELDGIVAQQEMKFFEMPPFK